MPAQQNEHPALREQLRTRRLGTPHRYLESVTSTNDVARNWAHEGAAEGAVVWAEHQSAGRGRQGSAWRSARGKNLTFSVVLRPQSACPLGLIPLITGVALSGVLESRYALQASLKWPNDVLIGGAKICGILCEGVWKSTEPEFVIVGIGCNVNQVVFEGEHQREPTSLRLELGRLVDRTSLLADVLHHLEETYLTAQKTPQQIRELYNEKMIFRGEQVELQETPNAPLTGKCLGIAPDGGLLIESNGSTMTVYAGEVSNVRSSNR